MQNVENDLVTEVNRSKISYDVVLKQITDKLYIITEKDKK